MLNTKRWLIAGLVALNAVLGVAAWQALAPGTSVFAQAQRRGSSNDYIILTRHNQRYMTVYAFDATNGTLVGLRQDSSQKQLIPVSRKDALADLNRMSR